MPNPRQYIGVLVCVCVLLVDPLLGGISGNLKSNHSFWGGRGNPALTRFPHSPVHSLGLKLKKCQQNGAR